MTSGGDIDVTKLTHYYVVSLRAIPFNLPVSMLAPALVPTDEEVGLAGSAANELRELGFVIVGHQLQVYKEDLPAKFGYITYLVKPCSEAGASRPHTSELDDHLHDLFVRWATQEHHQSICECDLLLPPSNEKRDQFSCLPLLQSWRTSRLVSGEGAPQDREKTMSFALALTTSSKEGSGREEGEQGQQQQEVRRSPANSREVNLKSATVMKQLSWLRKYDARFPKEGAGSAEILRYFETHLGQLVTIVPF